MVKPKKPHGYTYWKLFNFLFLGFICASCIYFRAQIVLEPISQMALFILLLTVLELTKYFPSFRKFRTYDKNYKEYRYSKIYSTSINRKRLSISDSIELFKQEQLLKKKKAKWWQFWV